KMPAATVQQFEIFYRGREARGLPSGASGEFGAGAPQRSARKLQRMNGRAHQQVELFLPLPAGLRFPRPEIEFSGDGAVLNQRDESISETHILRHDREPHEFLDEIRSPQCLGTSKIWWNWRHE